jgi:phosphatidylglycerophosphate synthase
MPTRALVIATAPGAEAMVAGLPLAARAVLTARAAGSEEILVVGSPAGLTGQVLARRGVPVTWIAPGAPLPGAGDEATVTIAGDVLVDGDLVRPLGPGVSPADLERALLDHHARRIAGTDSFLAQLVERRLARPLTRVLLPSPASPTQVTLAGLALGVLGGAGLATVSPGLRVAGLLLVVLSNVLDCVDGDLARARFEQTPLGARLDLLGDYAVHLAVIAGLVVGLLRQGLAPGGYWAAGALGLGVLVAMAAMHALFLRGALAAGDLHSEGDGGSLRGTPAARVIERLASRDYTYLLLVFALLGRLEWFLYAAAVGAWAFVLALGGYAAWRRARRGRRARRAA